MCVLICLVVSVQAWSLEAERLAQDVCAQADLREALVAAGNDGEWTASAASGAPGCCERPHLMITLLQAKLCPPA